MIKEIIRDLWLCPDCVPVAVNGDYSHLDYIYDRHESAKREAEIDDGLEALPGLVPDDGDDQMECCDCGFTHNRLDFQLLVDEHDEPNGRACPECKSDNTRERDSGTEEFSHRECDCCSSDLAGSRMRFAQLIHGDAP